MIINRTRIFEHEPVDLGYKDLDCITVNGGRRYVTPAGISYPSITAALGARPSEWLGEWRERVGIAEADRVCHHASTQGTALHTIAERYLDNKEDIFAPKEMPHIKYMFKTIQPVLDRCIGKVLLQECPLYSDHLKLAGRVDLIAYFEGKLSVIDFKTSGHKKKKEDIENYFIQECAYSIMWEERTGIPITNLVTIMAVTGLKEPLVFKDKRDNWTDELLKTIKMHSDQN